MRGLQKKIQIGISQCLLGDKVRFDAGHKRDAFVCNVLSNYFNFVAVCPEVDIGLGIPRSPIRLVGSPNDPQLVNTKNESINHTAAMKQYAKHQVKSFTDISGYILKAKSPSCGLFRVKVYQEKGMPSQTGQGIYAKILADKYPNLPIEEDGRLQDPMLRENFIERVFIYRRWQEMMSSSITKAKIIEFHTMHKLTIMAHSPKLYRELGTMISNLKNIQIKSFSEKYLSLLMYGLRNYRATQKKNTNVLQHIAGYLKKQISSDEKQYLAQIIENYYLGHVPLIVPITLLQFFFKRHPDAYILEQTYLYPYPEELRLRNLL